MEVPRALPVGLHDAEGDSGVTAIILTGGSKFFISGTDIEFLLGEGEALTAPADV